MSRSEFLPAAAPARNPLLRPSLERSCPRSPLSSDHPSIPNSFLPRSGIAPIGPWLARIASTRTLIIALERPDGGASRHQSRVLGPEHPSAALSLRYAERLLKFLLWQKGGCTVQRRRSPRVRRPPGCRLQPDRRARVRPCLHGRKGLRARLQRQGRRGTRTSRGAQHRAARWAGTWRAAASASIIGGQRPEGRRRHRRQGRVLRGNPMGPLFPEGPGLPHRGDPRVSAAGPRPTCPGSTPSAAAPRASM